MVRKGKYYRHGPAFDDEIDQQINRIEKKAKMIQKLHTIMKTIKANGMYSDKEMNADLTKMENMRTPEGEKKLLVDCWNIRKQANKQLMEETEKLIEKMKEGLKNDTNTEHGKHRKKDP